MSLEQLPAVARKIRCISEMLGFQGDGAALLQQNAEQFIEGRAVLLSITAMVFAGRPREEFDLWVRGLRGAIITAEGIFDFKWPN